MDKNQLGELIKNELRNQGISSREAGRRMGVAHTTVARIMEGKTVSLVTLTKVAEFLEIETGDLLGSDLETDEGVASAIAVLMKANPDLGEVFREAAAMVSSGQASPDVVAEIIRYAAWRLADEGKRKQGEQQQ